MPEERVQKRVCKYPGCETVLRMSNRGSYCGLHEKYEALTTGKTIEERKQKEEEKVLPSILYKDLVRFLWPVPEFKILEVKDGKKKVPLICPYKNKEREIKWYEPMKERNLPFRLAEVDENDENGVLRFVNKYGLLGENRGYLPYKIGESLYYFQEQVRKMRDLIEYYKLAQARAKENDLTVIYSEEEVERWSIDGEFRLPPEPKDERLEKVRARCRAIGEILEVEERGHKLWKFLPETLVLMMEKDSPEAVFNVLREMLVVRIVQKMEADGVHLSAQLMPRGDIKPIYSSRSLTGAIYLQLYMALTKRWQYKECIECGSLFFPRRADNNFCSKRCRNRYYIREWRRPKEVKRNK